MLDKYLHTIKNVADPLVLGGGRVLRSDSKRAENPKAASQTYNEKKDQAAMRKLEKEMDMLTDPILLQDAREDQDGLRTLHSLPCTA